MNMPDKHACDHTQMLAYLNNQLHGDDLLEFLLHIDECQNCRDCLLLAIKGSHEHYYRKAPSKKLKKEMKELIKLGRDDFRINDEEMPDVA